MTNVDYKVRIPSIEDFDEEKGLFVLKEHINDIECTSLSYEIKNIIFVWFFGRCHCECGACGRAFL